MLAVKSLFNKKALMRPSLVLRRMCEVRKAPTFEELLEQNTPESLKLAAKQLAKLEVQEQEQRKTLEELTGKVPTIAT